jgi:hypothetical protein
MMYYLIMAGLALLVAGMLAFAAWFLVLRRRPRKLDQEQFQAKWRDLQKLLPDKKSWPQAVSTADKLLDEALKKRRFKGKVMGERLVRAQRLLSDNDGVWFGHKLRNKIESEPDTKLKEKDVKDALIGTRQALKDLGALPDGKQRNS